MSAAAKKAEPTAVWISTELGRIEATLLERAGDWAITTRSGVSSLTHLPTGYCITRAHELPEERKRELLFALGSLPRWDFQSIDVPAIKRICKRVGVR